jgi:Tol biopolymer transport system component/tRNA A-37 threonylcarbamoyl transferase component Bud32
MSDALERLRAALADRYRIERELGRGGMATVYLAEDLKHKRHVALKVLKPELAAVLGAERFVQEITTTAALQHPHILPLFDSGTADGFLYYVMPYIEGETLRTKLDRETQLGIDEAVKITTEVADALDYAHRHGVIHRDIKPENILLHDGRPMVADFGIALALSAAAGGRMTETGMSLGTPHYMSPEQATAEKELTNRSDIYSLGSVLYEMLTGNPPHTGASAQQIIMKIVTEEAAPVTKLRKAVPPNVAAAVAKAVERLPADRFESAHAFAEALRNPGFTTTMVGAGGVASGRPWLADRRSRLALAVAAISLATALVLVVRGRGKAMELAEMSVAQNTFRQEAIFSARWAPDGKTIVYSAAARGSNPRLFVVRPDYPEPEPLGPDSTHLLAVSSTGEVALLTRPRWAGHRLFTGTLARMPLGGGAPREVMENVQEADWSPDGSQLAITHMAGELGLLEYPVGRVLYQSRPGGYLSDLRVSPAGDRIALFDHQSAGDDRGVVVVVDTTGKASTVTREFWGLEGLAWEPGGQSVLFAGAGAGGMYQVHRVDIGREARLALPSPGTLTLQDVARDGRWLVTRDDQPNRIFVHPPGSTVLRDLSWLDWSVSPLVSGDGELFAFTDESIQAGPRYAVMIRKTDGSPVVRLGDGHVRAISRDKRWVVGVLLTIPQQFMLYPTGAGEARPLSWTALERVNSVDFFPDSRSLFVCGNEQGKPPRCYRSPLDASSLEPVTPDSVNWGVLRPDGLAVAHASGGSWWVYPLDGGTPRLVPALGRATTVLRWSPDGTALWVAGGTDQAPRLELVDVANGRRTPLVSVETPSDLRHFGVFGISVADDPRVYAYPVWSYSSLLFTIQGVR